MRCHVAKFSSLISFIRKALAAKWDVFPLYYIIVRDICQTWINIIQYQLILTVQPDHPLFAFKKFLFRAHSLFVKVIIFILPQNTFGDILRYHQIIRNFSPLIVYEGNSKLKEFDTGQDGRKKTAQSIKIVFRHKTYSFSFPDLFLDFIGETCIVK